MKKNLGLALICLIMMIAGILNAQTKKGNWLIEGSIGNIELSKEKSEYNSGANTNTGDVAYFDVELNPGAGYFISDNIIIGTTINLGYGFNNMISYDDKGLKTYDDIGNSSKIGFSPYIRAYFTKNSKNRFYGQLNGGMDFNLSSYETTDYKETGEIDGNYNSDSKYHTFIVGVLIGFNHFLTQNIAFNSAIGDNYSAFSSDYTRSGTMVGFNPKAYGTDRTNNFVWKFGFSIFLAGKKG